MLASPITSKAQPNYDTAAQIDRGESFFYPGAHETKRKRIEAVARLQ